MDPDDRTSMIIAKIQSLEPPHYASLIIEYFLSQEMKEPELIRMALGPNTLIQSFCAKAKSDLGLSSNDHSSNPSLTTPININDQTSSPRYGFLDLSTKPPRSPFSPSLTSNTLKDNPNFHAVSSQQLSKHLSFVNNEINPSHNLHKRSFSANDACLEPEKSGSCFLLEGLADDLGFPGDFGYAFERMESAQEHRMVTAQSTAACGSPMWNRHRQGSVQFGGEGGNYNSPGRHESENSVSKQIYLTLSSESTLTNEDISNYFSHFGVVESVRIPLKGQRMYGFVFFANDETVRTILARENPHFICGSSVCAKPCREKETNVQNKSQQQQSQQMMDRGNYSTSPSSSGLDSRKLYNCPIGPRRFLNKTPELLGRKTVQADLQQATKVTNQRRRSSSNLQLPKMENTSTHHHQRSPSLDSLAHFPPLVNPSLLIQSDNNEDIMEGDDSHRGESHFLRRATSNEESGYNNDSYKEQETSVENTLHETRQTKSDTEENKE